MNPQVFRDFLLFSLIIAVPVYCCQQPCIYLSNTTNILAVPSALNQQPTSVISGLSRAVALDVHVSSRLIFWSDVTELSIKRANVDGSNVQVIVKNRLGVCDGLAVEWMNSLLYWTDTSFNKIEVSRLDGSKRKVLISTNLDEPRGISVDPQSGLMFWTDWGKAPKIEKSSLNGEGRQTIVSSSLHWPNDIALDHSQKKIYWVDAFLDKMEHSDYSGANRVQIFYNNIIHPFGVEILSSYLYWTDWNTQSGLHQMDKSTGSLIGKTYIPGQRKMGLAILDSSRQPSSSNPCQSNNGGCEFLCLLKPNGFKCVCPFGKVLQSDGKKCKIPDYGCQQPCIYLSNTTHIMAVEPSLTHHPLVVVSNLSRAVALDVHVNHGMIFWSDVHDKSIKRANVNGGNIQVIVKDNVGVVDGLAVQWRNDLLYWTDTKNNKIEVSRLDGSRRKVVFYENLDEPRGIAVDPDSGLMFWSDWGLLPKIERSYLNGENRQTIVDSSLGWPNDIALDHNAKKIYWVDAKLDVIESADYSGSGRNQHLSYTGVHPFGVAILQKWLYWTDWATTTGLHQLNRTSGKHTSQLYIPGSRKMGLTVYDSSRQSSGSNPCQSNNGGCEFLCMLKPNGFKCVCPFGKVLQSDGKKCKIPDIGCQQPCLYLSNTTHILVVDKNFNQYPLPVLSHLSRAVALDVHVNHGMIFWSDVQDKSIKRANVNGGNIQIIVNDNVGVVDGLAVQWRNDLLYWADTTNNKIEISRLDGSRRKVLFSEHLDEPRDIAIDPDSGLMFWTDWGSKPKIERAYLNGENRQEIVNSSLGWPNGIVLDYASKMIYWVDAKLDMIESADYSGFSRNQHFSTTGIHPFGVAIWDTFLYWTDWSTTTGLHQLNRTTGNHTRQLYIPGKLMGLVVFDGSRQSTVANGCQVNNGGCSFLCLLKPNGFVCSCPNGRVLSSDGKTCRDKGRNCSRFVPKPNTVPLTNCSSLAGSQCSFKCRNGYSLTGGSTIVTCSLNGTWSGGGPSCSDSTPPVFNTCPGNLTKYAGKDQTALVDWSFPNATDNSGSPPTVSSSSIPPLRLREGMHYVTYTATDQAGNKATCSFKVTIKVIRCISPNPSGALYKTGCENHYGGTCNFTCTVGYRMIGNATLNCLSTNGTSLGVWDSQMPHCEEVVCPALATPSNAVKSNCYGQVNESIGTVCQFSCVHGFQPSASQIRKCLANGTWSGKTLVCSAVSCPPLAQPKFGSAQPPQCLNGGKYNDVCSFACQNTFRMKGTGTRTCAMSGQWTGSNDTYCEDVTPPTFSSTCPSDMALNLGECASNISVNWNVPVATDNSGSVKVHGPNLGPPLTLGEGIYSVNYTAEDATGNRRSCIFKIQVTRKRCTNLSPPENGVIISMSCSSYFGSVASIDCKPGYHINGAKTRACLSNGQWSGVSTTCSQITCKPLPTLMFGTVEPASICDSGLPVYSGRQCYFKCNTTNGFKIVGPTQATCTVNGTWSTDIDKISCKDIQRPVLKCPKDLTANTDAGKAFATLSWNVPEPHDNSGEKLKLTSEDNIKPPHRFKIGQKIISYSTVDSSGLNASCSFKITVKDGEPPKVIFCPPKKEVKSEKRWINVHFPKAKFKDNVGVDHIVTNPLNGSKFLWGTHNVTQTAYDKAGNIAKCIMKLKVESYNKCKRPSPPENGAIACDNMPVVMFCTIHCNKDYAFFKKPPQHLLCDSNGKWNVDLNKDIPDCSEATESSAKLGGTLHYLVENCDEQDPNEVKVKFLDILKLILYEAFPVYCSLDACKLDNIYVKCGKKDDERRRRNTQNINRLEIDFQMKIPFPKNQSSNINKTVQNMQTSVFQSLNKSASTIEIRGVKLKLESPPTLRFVGLSCKDGFVLNGAICAACPPGYYYESSSKSCSICPVNQYQKKEAQMSCLACPSGTSTLNSKGSKTCKEGKTASSGDDGNKLVVPVAVSVAVLVVVVGAIVAAFFVVKRSRNPRQGVSRTDSHRVPITTYGPPSRTEFVNPAYGDVDNENNENYDVPSGVNHVNKNYDVPSVAKHVTKTDYDVPCASKAAGENAWEASKPKYYNIGLGSHLQVNNPTYDDNVPRSQDNYDAKAAGENAWEGSKPKYYNIGPGSHLQVNNPTYDDTVPSRQDNYEDHIYESIRQQKPVGHRPASMLFETDNESQGFQMTNMGFQVDADRVNPSEANYTFKGESIA